MGILSNKGEKDNSCISARVLAMVSSWDSFLCTMAVEYKITVTQSQVFRSRFGEIYQNWSESDYMSKGINNAEL